MNNRKSQDTTDKLLSLGMALNADRATMEQRIRGIFSRKKSGIAALTAAVLLTAAVGIGCFTTACRPVTAQDAAANHTAELSAVFSEPAGSAEADAQSAENADGAEIGPLLTFAGPADADLVGDTITVVGKDGTVKEYAYVDDGIMEHSDKIPDRKYVTPAEAAKEAARVAVTVYGADAPEGPIHVAMQYYEGFADVYYEISFGSPYNENDSAFGLVDAESGTLLQLEGNHWGKVSKEYGSETVNQKIRDWNWEDPAYQQMHTSEKALATAMELVRTCFPTGNIIPKNPDIWDAGSHTDGEQITWEDGYLALVDAYIRMDKDPCYYVQVAVPLEDSASPWISIFNTYPRGWEYCNNQIWEPSVLQEELQWLEEARNGALQEEPFDRTYSNLIDENVAIARAEAILTKVGTAFEPKWDDYQGDPEIFSKLYLAEENVWPDDSYAEVDVLVSESQVRTRLIPGTLVIIHGVGYSGGKTDVVAVYTGNEFVYADMDSRSVIGVPVVEMLPEPYTVEVTVVTFEAPGRREPIPTPVP